MQLEIVTPEKTVYSGKIKLIQLPGSNGSFEILNNHAPIISSLDSGKVKVVTHEGDVEYFDISSGVVECNRNHVIVLAETTA